MEFAAMQHLLVILALTVSLIFLARRLIAFFRGQASPSCGCGCSGCGSAADRPSTGPQLPMFKPPGKP